MGAVFRDCCQTSVRPFLLAALLAGTWLMLAAGPASAAADKPDPLGTIAQAADSLLQETVDETVPEINGSPDPVVHEIPVPVVAVPPVSGTAATVVDAVADATPVPVPGGTTGAVTGVVDSAAQLLTETVTDTPLIETVTGAVDGVVSVVDSLAPALPVIQVPHPEIPQPQVPRPERPVKAPENSIPGRSAGTVAPPSDVRTQPASPALGGEAAFLDGARPAEVTVAAQQVRRAVSPLEFLANTQAVRALTATIGYIVSAAPAPENEPEAALRFAGFQNQTGPGSAGIGSAGAEASGDVDGFWNQLHDAGSSPVPDAALILAASPAFDPGSSPD